MDKLEKSLEQEPLYQDVDLEHFQEKDQLVPITKRSLLSGIFPPCFRWLAELWMLIIILVLLSLLRSRKCVEVMHRQAVRLENQYPMPERKYIARIWRRYRLIWDFVAVGYHIGQSLNDPRYAHEHMFDNDEIFKGILHNWLELEPSISPPSAEIINHC